MISREAALVTKISPSSTTSGRSRDIGMYQSSPSPLSSPTSSQRSPRRRRNTKLSGTNASPSTNNGDDSDEGDNG